MPRGHRKWNLSGDLQFKIETGAVVVAAGEIQQPDAALLREFGMGGVIHAVRALL